jgi:hypothetical protein
MITVQDLLRERLDDVRLAVLSACQSGVSGTQLIGEVVGLPSWREQHLYLDSDLYKSLGFS